MKTILVTGASGFIGRNVEEYFSGTYHVLAPNHQALDLLSPKSVHDYFSLHQVDCIINCAAVGVSSTDNPRIVEHNCRMYHNLKNYGRYERMIHMGSGAEYDKSQDIHNIHETEFDKNIPQDPYGFAKYLISKDISTDHHTICLRMFGVFGKYEDYERRFISNSILKSLVGLPIIINRNVMYSWIYINDLMPVIAYFIENGSSQWSYNVTAEQMDLVTIAKLINSKTGNNVSITTKQNGMNREYTGNNARLRARFSGQFKYTPMEKAIEELVELYKKNLTSEDEEWLRNTYD